MAPKVKTTKKDLYISTHKYSQEEKERAGG
jgi:hypothetical protein